MTRAHGRPSGRRQRQDRTTLATIIAALLVTTNANAATITEFGPFEDGRIAWEEAVGEWETIGFTEQPPGTFLTDEYLESDGIVFGNNPQIIGPAFDSFVMDGFGIRSAIDGTIEIDFTIPLQTVAFDLSGSGEVEFFSDGESIAGPIPWGLTGSGLFAGFISDTPFDRVVLTDSNEIAVDDLRYGMIVPGPGVAVLFVLAGLPGFAGFAARRRQP